MPRGIHEDPKVVIEPESRPAAILFVGAGASRAEPLCLPTMAEFFAEVVDAQLHIIHPDVSANLRPLLTRLIAVSHPDVTSRDYDLETVIKTIDSFARLAQEDPQTLQDNIALYWQYQSQRNNQDANWIRRAASEWMASFGDYLTEMNALRGQLHSLIFEKYRGADGEVAASLYAPIMNHLVQISSGYGSRCLPIFTTNYDRSLETMFTTKPALETIGRACAEYFDGVDFRDGFASHPSWLRELAWSASAYTDNLSSGSVWVPYFKLHGSLGWRLRNGEVFATGVEEKPIAAYDNPVVIYPGATKDEPTDEPFRSAYFNLDAALHQAKVCLVIGFSMRDEYLRRMFAEALSSNKELEVQFLLPGDPGIALKEFMAKHPERCELVSAHFGTEEALELMGCDYRSATG